MSELHVDAEVVVEEDASPADAVDPVRPLPTGYEPEGAALPVLRPEVKTAVLATAGGVLAGAATVAAVRAVTGAAARARAPRRLAARRRERQNVVASRSFLVDVHLLGR